MNGCWGFADRLLYCHEDVPTAGSSPNQNWVVQRFQPGNISFRPFWNLGVNIFKSFGPWIKERFCLLLPITRSALCFTFLSLTLSASAFSQQFGGIRGQVVDSDFGQPIAKVMVTLSDTPFGALTDDQGNFTISGIPPGAYTCLLYTSPSPRDRTRSRMPSSA